MRRLPLVLITILLFCAAATAQQVSLDPAGGREFTIAVVRDGPLPDDRVLPMVREELLQLAGPTTKVTFKEDAAFDGGWSAEGAARALGAALDDAEVDFVFVYGHLASRAAALRDLPTPVVSGMVQRSDLFSLHDVKGDRSLKENLSFVLIPLRAEQDLRKASELVRVDEVVAAVRGPYLAGIPELHDEARALEKLLGARIRFWPVDSDINAALKALGDAPPMVLMAELPGLSETQRGELFQGLTERGIATFSLRGHQDVRLGAMASRTPDFERFLARRVALNLSELIRGASTGDLPVVLPVDAQMLIDARTATRVGCLPDLETMSFVRFLNEESLRPPGEALTLAEAFDIAEANNINLAIADQDVETSFRERQLARTTLYPQIAALPQYENVKIPGLEGIIPDQTGSIGLRLNQMIYDDRRVADSKSANLLYQSSQESRETRRLDVLTEAGFAYYELVLAQVLYRVQVDNLRLTEDNLELAKLRVDLGYSGRDEVFRWEAELASRRTNLLGVESAIEANRIALNQILAVDQNRRWSPQEVELDPGRFPFIDGRLGGQVYDLQQFWNMRQAAVRIALENSPELRFYDRNIEAGDIQLKQRKRRWYLPVFTADVSWDYDFYRSPDLIDVDKDAYRIAILGAYPIFEGGARKQEIRRVDSTVSRLQRERDLSQDLVERRTRTAVRRMEASFPSIGLTRTAAENARKNLAVVQDKYALGLVNVTDLLEAQNSSFSANQAAAAANYFFLRDLIEFQRAIAWFEAEKSPSEKDELAGRMIEAMQGGGE